MKTDPKHEHKADHKKPEPKPEYKPEPKPEEHPTKRVQMQKGTDEVNHGGTSFVVPKDDYIVTLPTEVADHVIRQGGAVDLSPKPAASGNLVNVKNVSDPNAILWRDQLYEPDAKGVIQIPVEALTDIEAHGFLPC